MEKEFRLRLGEFLNTECSEYGLKWEYRFDEDYELLKVTIYREDFYPKFEKIMYFDYDEQKKHLRLAMDKDLEVFETVKEYDWSVKYFWMLLAPSCFK